MKYNFDVTPDRTDSSCFKYDAMKMLYGKSDLLPMWVADTEFSTPDFIIDAIKERLNHPIFSYSLCNNDYYNAIVARLSKRFNREIHKDWIVCVPGVMNALTTALYAFTNPGDGVILQPPVYGSFFEAITGNNRKVVENQLIRNADCSYSFNYSQMDNLVKSSAAKLMFFCNPHNPTGSVRTPDEMRQLLEPFVNAGNIIVEDAVHSDIVFSDKNVKYLPAALTCESLMKNSITVFGCGKTFNLSGMNAAYCMIPDPELRAKFYKKLSYLHLHIPNVLSLAAQTAAYKSGGDWERQMVEYVAQNFVYAKQKLEKALPKLEITPSQATFLMWVNFGNYFNTDGEINDFFVNKAGIAISRGTEFGTGGSKFVRINIGCSRSMLDIALNRLIDSLNNQ